MARTKRKNAREIVTSVGNQNSNSGKCSTYLARRTTPVKLVPIGEARTVPLPLSVCPMLTAVRVSCEFSVGLLRDDVANGKCEVTTASLVMFAVYLALGTVCVWVFVSGLVTSVRAKAWTQMDVLSITRISIVVASLAGVIHEASRCWYTLETGDYINISNNFRLAGQALYGVTLSFTCINFSLTCIFILGRMRQYTSARKNKVLAFAACCAIAVVFVICGLGFTVNIFVIPGLIVLAIIGWVSFRLALSRLQRQIFEYEAALTKSPTSSTESSLS